MDILTALGPGGTIASGLGLVGIIGWLWRLLILSDRRWTAELDRKDLVHDAELAELRAELKSIREGRASDQTAGELRISAMQLQIDNLNRRLDDEMNARRAAEDRWRGTGNVGT